MSVWAKGWRMSKVLLKNSFSATWSKQVGLLIKWMKLWLKMHLIMLLMTLVEVSLEERLRARNVECAQDLKKWVSHIKMLNVKHNQSSVCLFMCTVFPTEMFCITGTILWCLITRWHSVQTRSRYFANFLCCFMHIKIWNWPCLLQNNEGGGPCMMQETILGPGIWWGSSILSLN